MKSFFYILTALLPIASQVTMASPVAEAEDFSLEDRGNNGGWNDGGWSRHDHPKNNCRVKQSYPYQKYPCDSSDIVGKSNVGDNFAPVCKYQNWYKNSQGWWFKSDYKPQGCGKPDLWFKLMHTQADVTEELS
ncbi:hypothetical protein N7486_011469 [Penicillium sp. IBT 16267x]|nr:hypothetical protein N7486_011469 [Penicillium sp. IBT 16267x]